MDRRSAGGAKRLTDLDQRTRRRALAIIIVRSTVIVAVILAVYFLLPTNLPVSQWGEAAWLLILGLLFVGVLAWQVRRIIRSSVPGAVAIEVWVIVYVMFQTVMASVHLMTDVADPGSYTEPLDHVGALYFTAAIGTTVGFGDISAVSDGARLITTAHMVAGLAFIGVAAKLIVAAAKAGLNRPAGDADGDPGGQGDDDTSSAAEA